VQTLYHTTDSAHSILRKGFRVSPRRVVKIGDRFYRNSRGVYLASGVVDAGGGAKGDQLLAVDFPDDFDLSPYEIEDRGLGFTEWCMPATTVNSVGTVRLCDDFTSTLLQGIRTLDVLLNDRDDVP